MPAVELSFFSMPRQTLYHRRVIKRLMDKILVWVNLPYIITLPFCLRYCVACLFNETVSPLLD